MAALRAATTVYAVAFVASVACGSDSDPGWARPASTTVGTEAAAPRPFLRPWLPGRLEARLGQGLPVVHERLRKHASCRELFARLGADGAGTVDGASYLPASEEQERRHCGRGVFAVTTVGGSAVALCRGFGRLSARQAAIILIHEALHLAGQVEHPAARGAPDSLAITRTVMASFRLF